MTRSAHTAGQADLACRACSSTRVVHLAMSLTDGSPVELVSCLDCEARTWSTADGEVLAIADVLDRSRKSV